MGKAVLTTAHRGRKSRSQPVQLTCKHCNHTWNYYGRIDRYGTLCPRCYSWVTIPAGIRKIPPTRSKQPVKPGVKVKCYKCGHEWIYAGKYVQRILAGQMTAICCPACDAKIKLP